MEPNRYIAVTPRSRKSPASRCSVVMVSFRVIVQHHTPAGLSLAWTVPSAGADMARVSTGLRDHGNTVSFSKTMQEYVLWRVKWQRSSSRDAERVLSYAESPFESSSSTADV